MRSAAAALIAFPGTLFAHPGHGALEGHFHGWTAEQALLFAVIIAVLAFSVGKK
jgi:hypothetical protein